MKKIREQFQEIKNLVGDAKRILIASHENPDADAIGSTVALGMALDKLNLGHEVFLFSPEKPSDYLNFLPNINDVKSVSPSLNSMDLIFGLDYGDFRRLQLSDEFSEERIITIDHHLESSQKGVVKIIEPECSSTAEIIYLLADFFRIGINKDMASCLLAGIIYDTGGLKHAATSSQTLRIVSDLLSKGISFDYISNKILAAGKSLADSRIWAEVLSRVVFDSKKRFVFSWVSFDDFNKYQISPSGLDGISSLISTISGASLSLFLIEHERGKIKGSLRSEPHKGKDIIELAKALGGNGHSFAAGFRQEGSIEEVLQRVYNLID